MENLENTANTEINKSGPLLQVGQMINNQYQIMNKLGSGSFGEVYLGIDIQTEKQVAIKAELSHVSPSQLIHEANIMKQFSHIEGFPEVLWSGTDEENKVILVMELLGQDLQHQLYKSGGKMSLKTVLMLIDQMLKRIETLHNKQYLYRDIKPENWMIGRGKGMNTVYLIDFGLVKKFKGKDGKHIKYRDNKGLIGTARFVSINTHLGIEQSRRDDLESLVYIWIYLLKGRLPWMGLKADTKEEKHEKLKLKKLSVSVDQLCHKLPGEFAKYLKYCRSLKFEEQPDYCELKKLFKELFFRLYINWDFIWDWIKLASNGDDMKCCGCNQEDCHICKEQENQLKVCSIDCQSDDEMYDYWESSNIDSANKSQQKKIKYIKMNSQNSLINSVGKQLNNNTNNINEQIMNTQSDEQNTNNSKFENNQLNTQNSENYLDNIVNSQQDEVSNPNENQQGNINSQQLNSNNIVNNNNSNSQPVKKLSFLSGFTQHNKFKLTLQKQPSQEYNKEEEETKQQFQQQQQQQNESQNQDEIQQQQEKSASKPLSGINFKIFSPNQKNKINLDKYKNNSTNLFESIFNNNNQEKQSPQKNIQINLNEKFSLQQKQDQTK